MNDRLPAASPIAAAYARDGYFFPHDVLSAAEAQPLRLLGMKPMGNYAYSLEFSDGHDTGIFTLEFIRSLSD